MICNVDIKNYKHRMKLSYRITNIVKLIRVTLHY